VVPDELDIMAARNEDDFLPGLAFFRAVENLSGPIDTTQNKLQIYTNNTECLACDVPPEQLVGETPCVASKQCTGKSLYDIFNLDETPPGLKNFADSWGHIDTAAGVDLTKALPMARVEIVDDVDVEAAAADQVLRLLKQAPDINAPEKLPDVVVIEGEFTVYCKPSADDASESTCGQNYRNARAALAVALGDITGEAPDFSVSAWDKSLVLKAPLLSEFAFIDLQPLVDSFQVKALEGHPDAVASTFGFTVTIKDETERKAVSDKLNKLVDDATPVLTNVDKLDDSATQYVGIRLTRKNAIVVPGVPLGVKAENLFSGSIAPAVVVKAEHAYGGLHTATPGETYELAVTNFPAGNTVNVNVIDAATGQAVANQSATSIPIKLLKQGVTSAKWTLPEGLEPGDYLLEASLANAPIIKAQTMPFKVVA
jgi:hypothetical protein